MSEERKKILKYFGAEVVLTDPESGMKGAAETAEKLRSKMKNGVILGQFSNTENARAHYMTTAPEIWNDLNGEIDFLFIGAGTGGTLAGCYKYFKEKNIKPAPRLYSAIAVSKAIAIMSRNLVCRSSAVIARSASPTRSEMVSSPSAFFFR